MSKMMKAPLKIHGCGRTDAGVHATQYFAHLDIEEEWSFDPVERLNKMLPNDIAIFDALPVEEKANCQQDAVKRTYDYFIHFEKHPFLSGISTLYTGKPLNIEEMNKAAHLLPKHNDFRALCKTPDRIPSTTRKVLSAEILENSNGIQFRITAKGFLRGMIRLIVTKLFEVGQGTITVEELDEFIGKKENPHYKLFAPPQGLHLSRIEYPYLNIAPRNVF